MENKYSFGVTCDSAEEAATFMQALEYKAVLLELERNLRATYKYGQDEDKSEWAQEVREFLYEEMNKRNIDLWG